MDEINSSNLYLSDTTIGYERPIAEQAPSINSKAKEIRIDPLDHGFVVRIGCQSFAVSKPKKMLKKLALYLDNPSEVEKMWLSGKFKI